MPISPSKLRRATALAEDMDPTCKRIFFGHIGPIASGGRIKYTLPSIAPAEILEMSKMSYRTWPAVLSMLAGFSSAIWMPGKAQQRAPIRFGCVTCKASMPAAQVIVMRHVLIPTMVENQNTDLIIGRTYHLCSAALILLGPGSFALRAVLTQSSQREFAPC